MYLMNWDEGRGDFYAPQSLERKKGLHSDV